MKAYVLNKAGGVENLVLSDIEQPELGADEVLVQTKAISINPVDVKVRPVEEVLTMIIGEVRPVILGWDIAGTVADVGADVKGFEVGDKVFGMIAFTHREPGYYEHDMLSLAQNLADQAAVAIENAQLYEQAQAVAVLEERTRLARELHDSLAQSLTYLKIQVSRLKALQSTERLQELADRNRELTILNEIAAALNALKIAPVSRTLYTASLPPTVAILSIRIRAPIAPMKAATGTAKAPRAMTSREVPMAVRMGRPANRVSAGTTKKPQTTRSPSDSRQGGAGAAAT